MIRIAEIDRHNWIDVLRLSVAKEQADFVATNAESLAECHVKPECIPFAVYDGDTPVGFCMYCMDADDREYWIYRLMIDKAHQHKGYGKAAMELLLNHIRADETHHVIYISFEPENEAAKALYESLGFEPDGRIEDGEIVYRLRY